MDSQSLAYEGFQPASPTTCEDVNMVPQLINNRLRHIVNVFNNLSPYDGISVEDLNEIMDDRRHLNSSIHPKFEYVPGGHRVHLGSDVVWHFGLHQKAEIYGFITSSLSSKPNDSRVLKIESAFALVGHDLIDYALDPMNLPETFQRRSWGVEYKQRIENEVLEAVQLYNRDVAAWWGWLVKNELALDSDGELNRQLDFIEEEEFFTMERGMDIVAGWALTTDCVWLFEDRSLLLKKVPIEVFGSIGMGTGA